MKLMNRTILMLEHDEDDRYITQAVFDENQYHVNLHFVASRDDFWSYLKSVPTPTTSVPSLILLNYHTGAGTAVELLTELKRDNRLQHIPVVVLSGSVKPDIVKECYQAGASSFIQKPSSSQSTSEKISNFIRYWFETVELV
jgi:CheY-like chemotaxis protein